MDIVLWNREASKPKLVINYSSHQPQAPKKIPFCPSANSLSSPKKQLKMVARMSISIFQQENQEICYQIELKNRESASKGQGQGKKGCFLLVQENEGKQIEKDVDCNNMEKTFIEAMKERVRREYWKTGPGVSGRDLVVRRIGPAEDIKQNEKNTTSQNNYKFLGVSDGKKRPSLKGHCSDKGRRLSEKRKLNYKKFCFFYFKIFFINL